MSRSMSKVMDATLYYGSVYPVEFSRCIDITQTIVGHFEGLGTFAHFCQYSIVRTDLSEFDDDEL